ncbi:DNA polymerase epsilon catalytic subunit A [Acrasis kona]|uniref:DNA polymerase epsilon catalytic subunit A n=1 Tax=Acrasis kona TaxID=1008807 RepID=A0AAW2ZQB4_9EUKA
MSNYQNEKFNFYEHGDPFQTPSNTKPAQVVGWGDEKNSGSRREQLDDNLEEELRREQLEDSFVDEELDLVDSSKPVKYIPNDSDAGPPVCYSPGRRFSSKNQYTADAQQTTVLELSKLVNTLHKKKSRAHFLTSKWALIPALLILLTSLFLSGVRPYCTPQSRYFPCKKCPPHAECSLFRVERCVGDASGQDYIVKDGIVCVRNDKTSNFTYALSQHAKDILEEAAWPVDCLGENKQKMIPFSDLRSMLINKKELDSPEVVAARNSNVSVNAALNNLRSFLEENHEVFHIASHKDDWYSYHYAESPINCLASKNVIHYARNATEKVGAYLKDVVRRFGQEFENLRNTKYPRTTSTTQQQQQQQQTSHKYEQDDEESEEQEDQYVDISTPRTYDERLVEENVRHYDPNQKERVQILSEEVVREEVQFDVPTAEVYEDHIEHVPKKRVVYEDYDDSNTRRYDDEDL